MNQRPYAIPIFLRISSDDASENADMINYQNN